jgi:hypothetical protein
MHDTMQAKGFFTCVYWILFMTIEVHVFLNLVVAVVFEKMEERARLRALDKEQTKFGGAAFAVKNFVDCWQKFDTEATNLLKAVDLPYFLLTLEPPLGFS